MALTERDIRDADAGMEHGRGTGIVTEALIPDHQ
jgi:hypothetical protein